jgi:hypothetical protein
VFTTEITEITEWAKARADAEQVSLLRCRK